MLEKLKENKKQLVFYINPIFAAFNRSYGYEFI